MFHFRKILVVDDSRVYRELASTLLRPYCEEVLMAGSASEAIAYLDDQRDELDLVICDIVMPGADGFSVLEHAHGLPEPKPRVVMVTATSNPSDHARASEFGAAGYLAKPTTLHQILGCATREGSRSKPRWRCSGSATLLDPESGAPSAFVWGVYNISPGGAFLETKGPVPPASELHLSIELGSHKFRVRARVARVQEPSWLDIGGVGIEFVGLDPATEALLREALEEPGPIYQ